MPDLQRIQDDALLAIAAGDWMRAASHFAALEGLAPAVGRWSLRLGECLRRAGQGAEAVAALRRAVDAYARLAKAAKAAAVCEQILEIDEHNAEILGVLRQLKGPRQEAGALDEAFPPLTPVAAPELFEPAAAPRTIVDAKRPELISMAEDPHAQVADAEPAAVKGPPASPAPEAGPARPRPRVILPMTPFFSALSREQVRLVNARARLVDVSPGEILYAAGEPSESLFLVAAGEVSILLPKESGRLQRGDLFGEEVVVLPGHARLATMRAATPCQVLVLDGAFVGELVTAAPPLLDLLSHSMRERLLAMLARTAPILASLAEADRRAFLARFRFHEVKKDQPIGATPDGQGLFILLAGHAEASLDNRATEHLQPGDLFGEIALVTDQEVSLRVQASEKCFVLQLPKAEFEAARAAWPPVVHYLQALAENRLSRLEQAALEDAPSFQSVPLPPRVLLTHGDAETLAAYQRALAASGFLVDAAGDAGVATDLARNRRYDVVIFNLGPFGQAGTDFLHQVRRRDLDVPIILITRYDPFDRTSAAANYSVVRSFVEPFDVEDLVRAASRACHFHRLTRVRREAMTRLDSSGEWMGDLTGLSFHFEQALTCLWMSFQPIVGAVDSTVFAYEALLRSGEELLHTPLAVLRAAERLGRVHDVSRVARDGAAAALAELADPPILFLNVHSHDLLDPYLLDPDAPLSRHAPRIVLEITERTPLDELSDLGARIRDLRALGYRIALDNLGAGHAGVGSLAQLEPEVCKLDASLIRGVDHDAVKQDLVRAMLAVCRDMNILTICVGVETLPERSTLVRLGADLMQGFLFARPGPPFPSVDFANLGTDA